METKMVKRSYNQYCAIAHALDLVGERWTLLIVRELLTGPKRFTDLLNNLPAIGTNLLAARLKELEGNGLVKRDLIPPPAASQVYVLTELGKGLERVVSELWKWGSLSQEARRENDQFRPGWALYAMKHVFRPEKAIGFTESYEYHIGGEVFHARIDNGTIETGQGSVDNADFVLATGPETFFDIASQRTTMLEAVERGRAEVHGGTEIVRRSCEIFGLPTSSEELFSG